MDTFTIQAVEARQVLTTGGYPTVEARVTLRSGHSATAACPRGSSEGSHEAHFLVDGDPAEFGGRSVRKAVANVERIIAPAVIGLSAADQFALDDRMERLDGTPSLSSLGANAVLAVSVASARAAAQAGNIPLYQHISALYSQVYAAAAPPALPAPMVVVIEGGAHADNSTDLQEYLLVGRHDEDIANQIFAAAQAYHAIGRELKKHGRETNVGLEGAYAFSGAASNTEPLELISNALKSDPIKYSAFTCALDVAASEFFDRKTSSYNLTKESKLLSASQLIDYYRELASRYNITSIEDPFHEDAWADWAAYRRSSPGAQVIGDDLTVSDPDRIRKAISNGCIDGIILKPNQAGSVSRTLAAAAACQGAGGRVIVSHRGGGETNDTFIVDLAVAVAASHLKCGITRGERVEKYNYLCDLATRWSPRA